VQSKRMACYDLISHGDRDIDDKGKVHAERSVSCDRHGTARLQEVVSFWNGFNTPIDRSLCLRSGGLGLTA
jgi:hypothetical protein